MASQKLDFIAYVERVAPFEATLFDALAAKERRDHARKTIGEIALKIKGMPAYNPDLITDRASTPDTPFALLNVFDKAFYDHAYAVALQRGIDAYGAVLVQHEREGDARELRRIFALQDLRSHDLNQRTLKQALKLIFRARLLAAKERIETSEGRTMMQEILAEHRLVAAQCFSPELSAVLTRRLIDEAHFNEQLNAKNLLAPTPTSLILQGYQAQLERLPAQNGNALAEVPSGAAAPTGRRFAA